MNLFADDLSCVADAQRGSRLVWVCCASNADVFLPRAEYSMQDQRLQKHSFAPRGTNSDKSSSGQSKPKSKGTAQLLSCKDNSHTCSLVGSEFSKGHSIKVVKIFVTPQV